MKWVLPPVTRDITEVAFREVAERQHTKNKKKDIRQKKEEKERAKKREKRKKKKRGKSRFPALINVYSEWRRRLSPPQASL